MTTNPPSHWQPIHDAFCRMTGMPIILDPYRERCWFDWQKKGFTEKDILLVVEWIRAQNKKGGKYKLTFSKLIVETDTFEEKLGEARAESRKVRYSPARAATLKATGRSDVPPTKECVQAGERALGLLATFKRGNV